jgi:hypothetical protein
MRSTLLVLVLLAPTCAALVPALPATPCGVPTLACAAPNGGMEEDGSDGMPLSWSRYVNGPCDGLGVARTGAAARTGSAGVRVVDAAGQCTGFVSEPIPIVPFQTYNASFFVRAAEGAPLARIHVAWYANDGSDLNAYLYKDGFQITAPPEWRALWSQTAAPHAITARIWVYAPADGAGTFDVDDADFRAV